MNQHVLNTVVWKQWLRDNQVANADLKPLDDAVIGTRAPLPFIIDGVGGDHWEHHTPDFCCVYRDRHYRIWRERIGEGVKDLLLPGASYARDFRIFLRTLPDNGLPDDEDLH